MKRFLAISALTLALCACNANQTSNASPSWVTLQTGTGSDGMPITKVLLIRGDINKPLYGATCEGVTSPLTVGGAETALRCWWAGGGADFAAYKSGTGYIVRTRWVDEESGEGPWEKVTK